MKKFLLSLAVLFAASAVAQKQYKADEMLSEINSKRGEIGAVQASFETAIETQSSNVVNYSSSLSNIQDTDYVSAIMDFKKSQFTLEAMAKVMKSVMNSQNYVLELLK